MANVFPTLSKTSQFSYSPLNANAFMKYPVSLGLGYVTRTLQFLNSAEQRWTVRWVLFSAEVSFKNLNGYDLSVLRDFFIQMKGSYVDPALLNTFTFPLEGTNYNYCVFDDDDFVPTVDRTELFQVTLKIRQLRPN